LSKEAAWTDPKSDSRLESEGVQMADASERQFRQQVAVEKAKSLRLDLAGLRKSMLAEKAVPKHRLTGASIWKGIRSTASRLFEGMRDERRLQGSISGRRKSHPVAHVNHLSHSAAKARGPSRGRKVEELEHQNARLRSKLSHLKAVVSEEAHGDSREVELHQVTLKRRVHKTRPGAVGGVICAPPFCDGGELPAVLPGDSAAVDSRGLWQHRQE